MAIEIKVPSLGESVTEATVAKWLKQAGEPVTLDEAITELETDKITLEVYAPAAGTLPEILAEEGANVSVGAVLGRIAEDVVAQSAPHPSPLSAGGEREEPAPLGARECVSAGARISDALREGKAQLAVERSG